MFKESFKYYKSKQPEPDLSKVLRVSQENKEVEVINVPIQYLELENNYYTGLKPIKEWKIYNIKNKPGLIFIKNPFTSCGQRYWIIRCLKDFSKKPYKLNLDPHNYLKENETWWEIIKTNDSGKQNLASKLRWATLGYHHNWDTKVYDESSKTDFPKDLHFLCKQLADVLDFKNFNAEAAIVNYYYMNSTLSGHTDHSEINLDAPLFSLSFGQSAIFLLGGATENEPAQPILIESGDIIVMSKESRLCYHAVPKILTATDEIWNKFNYESNDDKNELNKICNDLKCWESFNKFIKTCRLNINVRQVLKVGQNCLEKE